MISNRSNRWYAAVLGGMALALLLAGAVVAAQLRALATPETVDSAIRNSEMIRVADIGPADGAPTRGVFVQTTSTGLLCLSDALSARSANKGGGCNSAADPLGGDTMFISFAYDGGPAVSDVKDARLIGLVSLQAEAVEVLMSDRSRRDVRLKKATVGDDTYRAFGYRVKTADLRRGVTPTAVIALNAAGEEIDRQATGFGD